MLGERATGAARSSMRAKKNGRDDERGPRRDDTARDQAAREGTARKEAAREEFARDEGVEGYAGASRDLKSDIREIHEAGPDGASESESPKCHEAEAEHAHAGSRKARRAMNAVKHGLTAQTPVLPGEDAGAYEAHLRECVEDLEPVGQIETAIVRRMAITAWRLERAALAECAAYTPEAESEEGPEGSEAGVGYLGRLRGGAGAIALLSRHEGRLHRQFARDLALFRLAQQMRAERQKAAKAKVNPMAGRVDRWGHRIGRYSPIGLHRQLLALEVELGLHGPDGPPP
jgi:hypothetical protein